MWYVLQVKGGQELSICKQLKEAGYTTLSPRELRNIRTKGAWKQKEYILFPNYVFVETDYKAEDYYRITQIGGVQRFLGGQHCPSCLSYLEEMWMKILDNNGVPLKPTTVTCHDDGNVELLKGVLLNFKSRIKSFNKRQRRAVFEITVCNEVKEITLSIDMINEEKEKKPTEASG